ncbi:MAG: hypothetical protein KJO44_01240 [Gemmatimonadetes bacterium]|nr:hypothetical protein [Gemmatimonadota bacterium]
MNQDAAFRFGGFIPDPVHIQIFEQRHDLFEPLDLKRYGLGVDVTTRTIEEVAIEPEFFERL